MSGVLSRLLGLQPGEALAVVGCGGKTSLIGLLAQENSAQKVLLLPTTHIGLLRPGLALCCTTRAESLAHTPQPGVQCLAQWEPASGKLRALPEEDWPRLAQGYDLVLMEADGSRMLPCKGWHEGEPVVPAFATRTIGVVTTAALGRPVGEDTVHRPEAFRALTGLGKGDVITVAALAAMVAAPQGMFRHAVGRRLLLINQVESGPALQHARDLAAALCQNWPGALPRILAGSVRQNSWQEL